MLFLEFVEKAIINYVVNQSVNSFVSQGEER
jgi:hypothetical protein